MAVDLFANAANTTLSAAIAAAGSTSFTVTSGVKFPTVSAAAGTQFRVIIDSELFIVTDSTTATWTVTPAAEGTTAATHLVSAPVTALATAGGVAGLARPVLPAPRSGSYITAPGGGINNTQGIGAGWGLINPYPIPSAMTVDRIGVGVVTAVASATVRLGIYTDINGLPNNLVLDAGVIDASTTGFKELVISQALSGGVYYWVVAVQQGGATSVALNGTASLLAQIPTSSGNSFYRTTTYADVGAGALTGALAATITLGTIKGSDSGQGSPRVLLRVV